MTRGYLLARIVQQADGATRSLFESFRIASQRPPPGTPTLTRVQEGGGVSVRLVVLRVVAGQSSDRVAAFDLLARQPMSTPVGASLGAQAVMRGWPLTPAGSPRDPDHSRSP